MPLNINILKELIILISGPLFQFIGYYILCLLFNKDIVYIYHYSILIFNLLPIYPLDGGKLLKLILDIFIPYKRSIIITINISYIVILILLIYILNININNIITIIFLLYIVTKEKNKINNIYNKFIIERYLNNYNYKRISIITNIKNLYRNRNHIFNINNKYILEKDYLKSIYNH